MKLIPFFTVLVIQYSITIASYQNKWDTIISSIPKVIYAKNHYELHVNHTQTESWYYNSPLSLELIRGFSDTFLDNGRILSEEESFIAIIDVINLRYLNLTRTLFNTQNWLQNNRNYQEYNRLRSCSDAQTIKHYLHTQQFITNPSSYINNNLKHLKKELIKRICAIEQQLKYKRRFDYNYLGYSIIGLAATALSAYWSYFEYAKIVEFSIFCNLLKQRGITITKERIYPYFPDDCDDKEALFKKYLKLRSAKENGYSCSLLLAIISAGLAFFTKELFHCACDPNRNNHYLPYYKKLLAFINYLEKHGYDDWKLE